MPERRRGGRGLAGSLVPMAIDVTDSTFQTDVIDRSTTTPVVVDLWAPWCGPCKTLGPILDKVVGETDGQVVLAKVNVDENPKVSQAFQVQSIPAVFAVAGGKVVDGFVGAQPEAAVREFVDRLQPSEADKETARLLAAGDEASLRTVLETTPDHHDAIVALADLTELRRLEGVRRDFVANVSHELKTPLTSIRGYIETLLSEDVPAETQRQFLDVVQRNALILRLACAVAVGLAVAIGTFFVVKGWSTARLVLGVYGIAMVVALSTGTPLTAIALDSGASATSAINIPLISAMGVGLASIIKGRSPLSDGFGLVALCSVMPIIVLLVGSHFLL